MPKSIAIVSMLATLVLLLGYQNCGSVEGQLAEVQQSQVLTGVIKTSGGMNLKQGNVRDSFGLDGCQFQIVVQDAHGTERILSPVGGDLKVDMDLVQEGTAIEFEGVPRPDLMDFCMAGEIFEITKAQIIN